MKDLAILITIYNDNDGLAVALNSIQESDNSFTVVIVDGASDEPPKIESDQYPFAIKLIVQDERSGIIGGLNEGLDYIRKKSFAVVARLDAGDRQLPNRLERQYNRLKEVEELAMVGSNAVYFDEETGNEVFTTSLPLKTRAIRKWCVFQTTFIHPTVMIRLDRIDPSLRYESEYLHIEDYVLFTKIAERYETENFEQPLVECLVRESGISLSNDRAQLLSGLRHHLANPRPLKPLWYAYVLKRTFYLALPFHWRVSLKKKLGFVRAPKARPADRAESLRLQGTRQSS